MTTALLFLTAPTTSPTQISHLLLSLQQHNPEESFHLVLSKIRLEPRPRNLRGFDDHSIAKETSLPVPPSLDNGWAGARLDEVEEFVTDQRLHHGVEAVNQTMYFVVDERGMADETCVLGVLRYEDDSSGDEGECGRRYDRVRMPWDEAEIVLVNVGVGNMELRDFVDREKGADENGWWQFVTVHE